MIFETQRDLVVVPAPLDRCFSYFDDAYSENTPFLAGGKPEGFEVFAGADRIDRFLYLGDPRFQSVNESSVLRIYLGTPRARRPRSGAPARVGVLERPALARAASCCRWRSSAARWSSRGRTICSRPRCTASRICGSAAASPRCRRIRGDRDRHDPRARRGRRRGPAARRRRSPTSTTARSSRSTSARTSIRSARSRRSTASCTSRATSCCRPPTRTSRSRCSSPTPTVIPAPNPSEQLVLAWEYFDGKRWRHRPTGPKGAPRPARATSSASTTTPRRSRSPARSASAAPRTWRPLEVNGEAKRWIRVRIEKGDYGEDGSYTLENDKWVWRDDRPLRPPALKSHR